MSGRSGESRAPAASPMVSADQQLRDSIQSLVQGFSFFRLTERHGGIDCEVSGVTSSLQLAMAVVSRVHREIKVAYPVTTHLVEDAAFGITGGSWVHFNQPSAATKLSTHYVYDASRVEVFLYRTRGVGDSWSSSFEVSFIEPFVLFEAVERPPSILDEFLDGLI